MTDPHMLFANALIVAGIGAIGYGIFLEFSAAMAFIWVGVWATIIGMFVSVK